MTTRHAAYMATGVGTIVLWLTHNFGIAVWVLLLVLAIRFILYLIGVPHERNPFLSVAVYLGTVGLAHLTLPLLLGSESLMPVIQALIIAATLFELKRITLDLPYLPKLLHIPESAVSNLESEVSNLESMLESIAAQLPATTSLSYTQPASSTQNETAKP